MSSIDQPGEQRKPAKPKKATPPSSTTRRGVPATRAPNKPLRRFALATLLQDIAGPLTLIVQTLPALSRWDNGARCVELARKVSPLIPSWQVSFSAQQQIQDALRKPLDDETAGAMLSMLLDAVSKRAPMAEGADSKIKLMFGTIADLGDPISKLFRLQMPDDPEAEALSLDGSLEHPVSPIVLALAVKKLIAKQVFELQPSELRKACIDAFEDLRGQAFRLEYFMRARVEIDQQLLRDGTAQEKTAARCALNMDDDDNTA